jgi:ParB family chromosome partitioning protein
MQADDEEALELAIIENIQRDDLDPIEKAEGFNTLIKKYEMTQQEVAEQLGLSRTSVTNFIRLLQLPDKIKEYVSRETLSMGHARCLLSLQTEERRIAMADRIAKEGLSVRETEDIVYGRTSSVKKKTSDPKEQNPHIRDLEKRFVDRLGTKVQIKNSSKNKGKIVIHYYSNEDFIRLAELMGIDL